MLFALGFLFTFLLGGLTGVMLASAPIDFHVSRLATSSSPTCTTCCSAARCSPCTPAIYYWFPKFTGRLLDERWGKVHFWMMFVGFHLTFLVQHMLGLEGMPRRVADYLDERRVHRPQPDLDGRGVPAGRVDAAVPVERRADPARSDGHGRAGDNPWGGQTLEWATTSPPPPENFTGPLPPIRSQRPVWDLDHPEHTAVGHGRSAS